MIKVNFMLHEMLRHALYSKLKLYILKFIYIIIYIKYIYIIYINKIYIKKNIALLTGKQFIERSLKKY